MSSSLIQSARSFIWNCTGYYYAPEWRGIADRLLAELKAATEAARAEADAAEELLADRAIQPHGGMTRLRGAIAAAKAHEAAAKKSAQLAATRAKELGTLLEKNNAAGTLGDTAAELEDANTAVADATLAWEALRKAGAPSEAWHELAARLNGGLAVRVEAAKQAGGNDAVVARHVTLVQQLMAGATDEWDARQVAASVDTVTAGLAALDRDLEASETGGGPDQLEALRKSAMRSFYDTVAGYDMAGVLETAAEKLRETDPRIKVQHLAGAMGSQAKIPERLEAALDQATDAVAIDRALQTALKSFRDSVATFATHVQEGSALPTMRARAELAVGREVDTATFDKQKDAVAQALQELRITGAPAYATLKQSFDEAVTAAYETEDYRTAGRTTLPALLVQVNTAGETYKASTEAELERLDNEVERLRRQLVQAAKSPEANGARSILTTIKSNLDEAANFLNCNGNAEAADPAKSIIAETATLLNDFAAIARSFVALNAKLAEVQIALGQKALAITPAADRAALAERLAALQAPNNGLAPAAFTKAVEDLKTDQAALTAFAARLKPWRDTASNERTALQAQYDKFAAAVAQAPASAFGGKKPDPGKGEIKAGLDALAERLKAEIGEAGFDTHKAEWTAALTKVSDALLLVWDAGASTLKDGAAVTADAQAGTARAELQAAVTEELQALKRRAAGYRKEIQAAKGNMGEYEVLMKELDVVPAMIEKDPALGRAALAAIDKQLGTIRGTPAFDQAIARAIAQVPTQWSGVLGLTASNLEKLRVAVAASADGGEFAGSLGAFETLIATAKSRFAADAFTKIAQDLADADPTGAKRETKRKQREAGLRLVRQYQANLDDPLLQHLQANPFGVPLFGPLFRFIDRLELELTRIAC